MTSDSRLNAPPFVRAPASRRIKDVNGSRRLENLALTGERLHSWLVMWRPFRRDAPASLVRERAADASARRVRTRQHARSKPEPQHTELARPARHRGDGRLPQAIHSTRLSPRGELPR